MEKGGHLMVSDPSTGAAVTIRLEPPIDVAIRELMLSGDQGTKLLQRWVNSMSAWAVQQMFKAVSDEGQAEPGGDPWPALSPDYADLKAVLGGPVTMGIGIATKGENGQQKGMLRKSLQGAEATDIDLSALRMTAGSTVPHALWFNDGTDAGMPARPFLPAEKFAIEHGETLFWELWDYAMKPGGG